MKPDRREVSVTVDGVPFRVVVVADGSWADWYEEAVYVDDSERNLINLIEGSFFYDDIMLEVDAEIRERVHERWADL